MGLRASTVGKLGLAAAGVHLGLVLYLVFCIFFAGESDWPMYWFIVIAIDAVLGALWVVSVLLTLALRRPRVGTVMLSQLARELDAPASGRTASPRWLRAVLGTLLISALVVAGVAAFDSGTLIRALDLTNFLFPTVVFGLAGSWVCGSLIVNGIRIASPAAATGPTARTHQEKPLQP